jgi:tetratricopeptide (TPR) repeat protein
MGMTLIAVFLLAVQPALADNQEKAEKKVLQERAAEILKEAKDLEKSDQLVEARARYANSQAFWETKDAAQAIKHIDEEIKKRVKEALKQAHQLYDKSQFKQAAEALENASKLGESNATLSYDLALCYQRMGDSATALAYLDQAAAAVPDPKRSVKIKQMRAALLTGEQVPALKDADRARIDKVNQLIESVGFEASLEEGQPSLQGASGPQVDSNAQTGQESKSQSEKPGANAGGQAPSSSPSGRTGAHASGPAGAARRNSSLCQALKEMGNTGASSPTLTFDLANCAQDNDRPVEASSLLSRYLEMSPAAADADLVRLRIADLNALAALPEQKGALVRGLYSSASRSLQERKYDLALAAFQKAATLDPDFSPTQWRLALLYEAMGDADQARQHFTRFKELETSAAARDEAGLHIETLDVKRETYDQEAGAAENIVSDLLNRAMNLTFNGMQDRAALRKQRAQSQDKKKNRGGGFFGMGAKPKPVTGGFSVPYPYAAQQLSAADDHLATALSLFPLGAAANELMGLVFLQANDGRSAMRCFDAVAAQHLPVSFYAEMRGHKQDHAVKCELGQDRLRLVFLSSYDKKSRPAPPAKPAGEDGLGDLVIDPGQDRNIDMESLAVMPVDIKRVETNKGQLMLKLSSEQVTLSPIFMAAPVPTEGPQGRRFANNYTRLFIRYPGLEDSKLGTEGLTTGEKIKLAYDIANAGMNIATNLNPIGSISALQSFIKITREIHGVVKSLRVNFAGWEKTFEDQQALQTGTAFRPIPTAPVSLTFLEELK